MRDTWYQLSPSWSGDSLFGVLPTPPSSYRVENVNGRSYLQDTEFLKDLDESNIKELFVKIIVLDWTEQVVGEIQGKTSTGQLNIDGASSLRRTGSLTFIPDENESNLYNASNLISMNKKVRIEIGYTNMLIWKYPYYANHPIVWMPLGMYVLTDVNMSQSLSGLSVSLQIQDKMCLLNGTCGGQFPAAVTLHTSGIGTDDEVLVPIYQIIQEVVSHFGGEDASRIIIADVPLETKELIKWETEDNTPLYSFQQSDISGRKIYDFTDNIDKYGGVLPDKTYVSGENIGYRYTSFTYPGELTADAGQTVCDILDKLRGVLGNFEYFYDLDGNFIFQEIKNYLNTSQAEVIIEDMHSKSYERKSLIGSKSVYDFQDGNLITSFANTPSYSNVKNDFIIWGSRLDSNGNPFPIRYHLALDRKPIPMLKTPGGVLEDWRNVLYRQGEIAQPYGLSSNFYYLELAGEWSKLYNIPVYDPLTETYTWEDNSFTWNEKALASPLTLDYYLDFIDTTYALSEFSVENIGRRSLVVKDDDVNCLFAPVIEDIIVLTSFTDPTTEESETLTAEIADTTAKGMTYALIDSSLAVNVTTGTKYQDAFSAVRDLLYQHTSYNTSITLQTIPIYHLDVNTRISVYDEKSGTNGDFMIGSISVPITITDTMSISASAVLERI